ncbi:MAG: protein translocase subunit SecF [Nanoarchaeota archaeon]
MKDNLKKRLGNFHDKYYKVLLLIPAIILILVFIQLGISYSQTGEFFQKDISLTGGTTATIYLDADIFKIEQQLSEKLEDLNTRTISDLVTREQKAVIIETKTSPEETKQVLEEYFNQELTEENSSFEFTGSSLSQSFYKQLLIAIAMAFIFMGFIVFILFRKLVPSLAVILSAFADILMTLGLINILGIELSTAGIVAFLMIIGYSVDTDILLTTHMLKRKEDSINKRIFNAFKTGTTMTLTSILAIGFAFIIVSSFSAILSKIFTILLIGLGFDLLNTWITNASLLKWNLKIKEK